jgi:hypothetical protein
LAGLVKSQPAMAYYNWIEISDFPNKGAYYGGDVLTWYAHPGSGLHGSLINHRVRPGEIVLTRSHDQDSHLFFDQVASGDSLPNARFIKQMTKDDGSDSIMYNYVASVEVLVFYSALSRTEYSGDLVEDVRLRYQRIEIKQDYPG